MTVGPIYVYVCQMVFGSSLTGLRGNDGIRNLGMSASKLNQEGRKNVLISKFKATSKAVLTIHMNAVSFNLNGWNASLN